ncbi:uncharacterized protein LOC119114543, partial [Pollicipes pollicipes]|uniref:uncharacterized protein LOC119114543 n=1 Tax=Pollicipes pollicipes TaxID=41117 RepID=UPI001884DFCD
LGVRPDRGSGHHQPPVTRQYYCKCRPGFYGEHCQYGALCDPDNMINPCLNNGTCKQRSNWVECKCYDPYKGLRCQIKMDGAQKLDYCRRRWSLACQQDCVRGEGSKRGRCVCHQGYQLQPDGASCRPTALRRYIIEVTIRDRDIQLDDTNIEARFRFNRTRFQDSKPLRIIENPAGSARHQLQFLLTALLADEAAVYGWVADAVRRGRLGDVRVRPLRFGFRSEPELLIMGLTVDNEGTPRSLGSQVRLTCRVRGAATAEVRWYKGGALINATRASTIR